MTRCPFPQLTGFGKRAEWFGNGGIIRNEAGTVVGHAKKTADFVGIGRGSGISDGGDFLRIWGDAISRKDIAKKTRAWFRCTRISWHSGLDFWSANVQKRHGELCRVGLGRDQKQ